MHSILNILFLCCQVNIIYEGGSEILDERWKILLMVAERCKILLMEDERCKNVLVVDERWKIILMEDVRFY